MSPPESICSLGVAPPDFNIYGTRRTNHEVMIRGTFANIRLKNEMAPGTEGGLTTHHPSGEMMTVYDAAMRYAAEETPLVVIGGDAYGTGSSRDWAAKGTYLLGVRAVIAEGLERIHRSNLIGMGVLPLQFPEGVNRKTLELDGSEVFDLSGLSDGTTARMTVPCRITRQDGSRHRTGTNLPPRYRCRGRVLPKWRNAALLFAGGSRSRLIGCAMEPTIEIRTIYGSSPGVMSGDAFTLRRRSPRHPTRMRSGYLAMDL